MKKSISIILLVFLLLGCATKTLVTFNSNVDGAEVYLDDEFIGTTPVEVEMSNLAFEDAHVMVKKDGYFDLRRSVKKEIKVANFIGGLFFTIPYLWCYGPKADQYYLLQEK